MIIRHWDPMAVLILGLPIVALVVYGSFFVREFVGGHVPPLASLAVLLVLVGMLITSLWRLSPVSVYRFQHSPARVNIQHWRPFGRSQYLEHELASVERISIERYPFHRGHRYVVCLNLRDGRKVINGMPDAASPQPIYDFAVRVARFYGLAEGPPPDAP
ncbi:hypothetical protein ECTPHS_11507 [Ectothiorhodospira sp. PHS-1]|nr:hypothetical protein ECTPHS_11507 [Ectothiorhodospira sp. PHS-1]